MSSIYEVARDSKLSIYERKILTLTEQITEASLSLENMHKKLMNFLTSYFAEIGIKEGLDLGRKLFFNDDFFKNLPTLQVTDLKISYRKLALILHPDANNGRENVIDFSFCMVSDFYRKKNLLALTFIGENLNFKESVEAKNIRYRSWLGNLISFKEELLQKEREVLDSREYRLLSYYEELGNRGLDLIYAVKHGLVRH